MPQEPLHQQVMQLPATIVDGHDQHLVVVPELVEDAPRPLENLMHGRDAMPMKFGYDATALRQRLESTDAGLQPVEDLVGIDLAIASDEVHDREDVAPGAVAVDDRPWLHADAFRRAARRFRAAAKTSSCEWTRP